MYIFSLCSYLQCYAIIHNLNERPPRPVSYQKIRRKKGTLLSVPQLTVLSRCLKALCGVHRLLKVHSRLFIPAPEWSLSALFSWNHADLHHEADDSFLYSNVVTACKVTTYFRLKTLVFWVPLNSHGLFAPFNFLTIVLVALTFSSHLFRKQLFSFLSH